MFERAPPPAAAWLPVTAWCVASLVTMKRGLGGAQRHRGSAASPLVLEGLAAERVVEGAAGEVGGEVGGAEDGG